MPRKLFSAVLCSFFLSACGPQLPPLNFSVPNVGPTQTKLNAELKAITVGVARPDEATGDLEYGVESVAPLWKTAIEEAVTKMAIFRDDAPRKLSLAVKILKVKMPAFGGTMVTESAARYEIIDRSDGSIIFSTDVDTKGEVPFEYAFIGVVRARESANRSIQNNILQFLQQLETVNLERPMFPAGRPAPQNSPTAPTGTKPAPTS
ncbi:UDP-N-acetylglucosamine acyltransferase [Azospirillum sp. RWY-5-1]|uniref:UDP-N-acetylglucosamine acyltransferase n=1 Tax=Azospirillum oleiclasticum TaxID=2735135 RepID=A0ABX2TF06_9PROT|nr:UDP-N-acetylglucosamine acyltransferase [Azospirillum oleiclasticum]NYZ15304.1 UDP-N-acetylglucosamine acyltransferase [Azospirillum oleiclasticum]NYZ21275.1 UDP-N-acetylglucosamine acyltransferase [Azospirillum oleiclasticum]